MPVGEIHVSDLEKRLSVRGVADIGRLSGGASSLTFAGTIAGGRRVIIKVAPPGVAPVRHRDVLRQARLITVLHDAGFPVPEVLWHEEGDPPQVPPLFAMSFIDGTSLEPLFDRDGDEDEVVVAARLENAAAVLAALHALDPVALGLGGEPRVGLGEEVDRWCRLLETVDPALAPSWPEVAGALRTRPVAPTADAVVHGDFRLGNLLARGAAIASVVDWEIWTVGDPRIDLGWFLINADPATYGRATRYSTALASRDQLVDAYTTALGRPLPDLDVFRALACFKSTATWSLIVKHNRRRAEPDPGIEAMAPVLPQLLGRARQLLDRA